MAKVGPDVRVKLSAEGVQEVVNAFKRIQQEADRTAQHSRAAGEGQAFLNKHLSALKDLLPALGVAAIVTGFIALAKSGLELADSIGKLQQKTGISTDTLSAFSFAARYADVSQEQLGKGLVKFTRSMDDYDKGAAKARDAIRGLFGNENALQGLSMDQRLQKITEKLASLEPGAKRTGAAIALFGRAGAELLPLLDEVGGQGLDALRKRAEALGLSFNKDAVEAAENLKRSMITLKAEAQGMATQFLIGLAPELANATNAITDATSEGAVNGFQKTGEYAGRVIKSIVEAFMIVGKTIAFVLEEGKLAWEDFGAYAKDTLKGIAGAEQKHPMLSLFPGGGLMAALLEAPNSKLGENRFMSRLKFFVEDAQKMVDTLFAAPPKIKKKKGDGSSSDNEVAADAAQKAALALAQAQADARLKVLSAQQKQQEAAEKEAYEKGLESLRQYYANRLKIAEEMGQAEVAAAQARLDAITTAGPMKGEQPDAYQARVAAAQADVDAKKIEVQTSINALRAEEAKAAADLQQKELEFQQKIQQAQGDRFTQARAGIAAEAAQLDVLLRKMGVVDAERAQRVAAFSAAGNQQIDFNQLQDSAQRAMDELATMRQAVDLKVQGGLLFAFQGEQQIMQLEKDRLPLLQQIADAMTKAAITPEQIQAAREFQQQLDQLSVSSNKAALEMAQFKQNVEGALTSSLTDFFTNGIQQADSFGDAMRGLALSVVQSLQKIAAQMLATYLIQKLLGFFGAAAGGASAGSGGGGGHAAGGLIRGPGTGTSDSIPARLSDFEYIMRASVVRQPGMLELLDALNYGTPSVRRRGGYRYADGGLVDVQAGGGGNGGRASLEATLGLDEGLLLRRLEASSEFQRVIVRTTQNNRKAMRQAIGR